MTRALLLNSEQNAERSVATGDDSSNVAGQIICVISVTSETKEIKLVERCVASLRRGVRYDLRFQSSNKVSYHIFFEFFGGIMLLTAVPEFKSANG